MCNFAEEKKTRNVDFCIQTSGQSLSDLDQNFTFFRTLRELKTIKNIQHVSLRAHIKAMPPTIN